MVLVDGLEPSTACVSDKNSEPTELHQHMARPVRLGRTTLALEVRCSSPTELRAHERDFRALSTFYKYYIKNLK